MLANLAFGYREVVDCANAIGLNHLLLWEKSKFFSIPDPTERGHLRGVEFFLREAIDDRHDRAREATAPLHRAARGTSMTFMATGLHINTGTAASPVWQSIGNVTDVEIHVR